MKAHKSHAAVKDKEKDVLKNLGSLIGDHVRKGLSKVEEIFKDNEEADDKLFSYFKFFMDDKRVASVTPSSKYIVKRVLRAMDLKGPAVVVEYGAADGVITRHILDRLSPEGRVVAVELNDKLYAALSHLKDPRLVCVNGDVRDVEHIAERHGVVAADVIVSGIPFAFLSDRGRHELLARTNALLRPGGRFVAYQVTTHLIPLLKKHFRRVKTEFEIRNIPPHFVFTAYK
jgi:phospholipid N-methyltransferase